MNKPKAIDKPVWVFFILVLVAGILMHLRFPADENDLFNEYYGFYLTSTYIYTSVATGFIFFWGASILLYLFFRDIFRNTKWALLAVILFYTSPAIMGSVFNFVLYQYIITFLLVNFYLTKHFIDKPDVLKGILLALVHSVLVLIYPCLVVLPILTEMFFLLNISTRNLSRKQGLFILPYSALLVTILLVANFVFKITVFGPLPYTSSISRTGTWDWFWWIVLEANRLPPLYIAYFLFSMVALNVIYFSNYFQFLKNKWIYTYTFILPVAVFIAEKFIVSGWYGVAYSRFIIELSVLIIGISGCFEFASWVRKRWGDRVYFIFKVIFFSLLAIQVVFCIIALLYLYPNYMAYRNWPLFFIKRGGYLPY